VRLTAPGPDAAAEYLRVGDGLSFRADERPRARRRDEQEIAGRPTPLAVVGRDRTLRVNTVDRSGRGTSEHILAKL